MDQSKIEKELKRLVELINYHNEWYFQKAKSKITDYSYDQLLERLAALEAAYPHLKQANSPTETLGERPSEAFKPIYHAIPMLSLAKTYHVEAIEQFVQRAQQAAHKPIHFICEPKIDGVALSIRYNQGKMVCMATRGDGYQGDDITQNACVVIDLPKNIASAPYPDFEVRGEAFMQQRIFAQCNQQRAQLGKPLWANPRNITAGTLKALDLAFIKDRHLNFYAYGFHCPVACCTTQEEVLHLLSTLGFSITPTYKVCYNTAEIMAYIQDLAYQKSILPVDIDGIVIKINNLDCHQVMGNTAKAPRWAIAYKYQSKAAASILKEVTFHVGRTGLITPVAHFHPIYLAGTMVKRASLHNGEAMIHKDLHEGDTIFIEKRGEIIPQVVGVDYQQRKQQAKKIQFIDSCPACHTLLYRPSGQIAYYCPNTQHCSPQLKAALCHFAHRQAMDIGCLGPKTIDLLFNAQLVKTVADLYTLHYDQIKPLTGFQALSTQKLLYNIEASKTKPFDKVFFALGIPHVGASIAKKIVFYFKNIINLQQASLIDLLQVPHIGLKIAQSIVHYFQNPYHQHILMALQQSGLQFAIQETHSLKHTPLQNKKVVISGTFQAFTRNELIHHIEQLGGILLSALSCKVDYLIVGDKAGPSKLAKATALNIPMLKEDDIIHMIQ